jgi:glycosyl transferase family 87
MKYKKSVKDVTHEKVLTISEPLEVQVQIEQGHQRPEQEPRANFWHTVSVTNWPRWSLLLLAVAIFCETSWLVTLAPTDITRYECYGLTFWLGSHATTLLPSAQCAFLHITTPQPALHMLPQEYPPLTLLAFSLPLLVPLPYYTLAFALLMVLVAALIYRLLARSGARGAAPLFLLFLALGSLAVVQERFDLLPAACTLICVLAAEQGRWRTAYLALALGALLKLYPIVMLPALFLAEQRAHLAIDTYPTEPHTKFARAWESVRRWRWQHSLLCVGLIVVVMGGFALLNFNDALVGPLAYFVQRPAQIESLASSVLWAGSHLGAPYTTIDFSFGSLNIEGDLMRLISPIDTLLTIVGILSVLWLQWRNKLDLAQVLVALVCILMTTGKVFSPQYLLWLFPLLVYIYARGNTNRLWLYCWAAISLLTTAIYILYYSHLPDPATAAQIIVTLPGFFELVALRNSLLLVTTLAFLCGWWGVRRQTVKDDLAR